MRGPAANPVVHLELRTGNLPRAVAFCSEMFGWRADTVRVGGLAYLALDFGAGIQGGVVEREDEGEAIWLPYVEVPDIAAATARARALGAAVPLEPREGPAGWRGSIASPAGAEIGLWEPKC